MKRSSLFRLRHVTGWQYLLFGLLLVALKFGVDALILRFGFGMTWTPTMYFFPLGISNVAEQSGSNLHLYLALMFVAAPFLLLGLWWTVCRIQTLQFPMWTAFLTVVPYVNVIFFLVLSAIPTHARAPEGSFKPRGKPPKLPPVGERRLFRSAALAVCLTALAGLALTFTGVHLSGVYGVALFAGLPICLGGFAAIIYGQTGGATLGQCIGVALFSMLVLGGLAILVALEGAICIVMAAPIWALFAACGGMIGYLVLGYAYRASARTIVLLLVLSPVFMGMEKATLPEPELRAITTAVDVDAPAQAVWDTVIAFPPIKQHRHPMFRTGIAAPLRATIEGEPGVGAVRYCTFTTGPFVEPITEWNAPHRLAFDVTHSPPTMEEWTPYNQLHTPHLHGTLVSERGCFELTALPAEEGEDARTRLSGTTWYRNHMWPAWYWDRQSDYIIHAIHREVLEHIRDHARSE